MNFLIAGLGGLFLILSIILVIKYPEKTRKLYATGGIVAVILVCYWYETSNHKNDVLLHFLRDFSPLWGVAIMVGAILLANRLRR